MKLQHYKSGAQRWHDRDVCMITTYKDLLPRDCVTYQRGISQLQFFSSIASSKMYRIPALKKSQKLKNWIFYVFLEHCEILDAGAIPANTTDKSSL